MRRIAKYRKTLAAVIAVLVLFVAAIADDQLTSDEWWQIAAGVLTALGVWGVAQRSDHARRHVAP